MMPEKQVAELLQRLQSAAGEHVRSVVLYGSAASPEFHADISDVNVLFVLHEASLAALQSLGPVVRWWVKQKHPAPMLFSRAELEKSADIFAIEMLDIQKSHRVLLGEDIFGQLHIPMHLHHVQVQHELRSKHLLLRQHFVTVEEDRKRVLGLMLKSVSTFLTLFHHALLALDEAAELPAGWRETIEQAERRMQVDVSAFKELLDVREKKTSGANLDVHQVFARYLAAIELVSARVDESLARGRPGKLNS